MSGELNELATGDMNLVDVRPAPALQHRHAGRGAGGHMMELREVDPYWGDLVRLLQVLRAKRAKRYEQIEEIRRQMSSPTYDTFIERALSQSE